MTGFLLSPGITPALVGACSIELPLTLVLAYVFFRGRGLEVAVGLNAIAYAAIKIYTDYPDLFDLILALTMLSVGIVWLVVNVQPSSSPSRLGRAGSMALATYAVPLGAIKMISDFYDPFDTFLACLGLLAAALLLRWALVGPSGLRSTRRSTFVVLAGSMVGILAFLFVVWEVTVPPVWLWALVAPFPVLVALYSK